MIKRGRGNSPPGQALNTCPYSVPDLGAFNSRPLSLRTRSSAGIRLCWRSARQVSGNCQKPRRTAEGGRTVDRHRKRPGHAKGRAPRPEPALFEVGGDVVTSRRVRDQPLPKRNPTPRTVTIQSLPPNLPRRLLTWVSTVRRDQDPPQTCCMMRLREITVSGWEASR